MSTTPNMGMVLPVPTQTLGPEWATEVNEAFDTVDLHDHTAGKGTPVPTAGLDINADLSTQSNKITDLKSTQYEDQGAALSGAPEANSVNSASGDLWWTNGSGVAVQITAGNSVATPSSSNTPAGIVLPYAGSSAPGGYLLCNGAAVSRTTYATLFGVVGTVYGSGDGSTTFNLPDMNGRAPIGAGSYTDPVSGGISRTLGQVLGAEKHVIVTAEMASHSHTATVTKGLALTPNELQSGGNSNAPVISSELLTTSSIGSNSAHNNMQPSLGLNFIIKT